MKQILFSIIFALLSQIGLADEIALGVPGYGGSGCPAGSASAALSPDAASLNVLFDAYSVQAGGSTSRKVERKSCNVAIPIHVPVGFSVAISDLRFRGFNRLPLGAKSQVSVSYFFAGAPGPTFTKNFEGPMSQDYFLINSMSANALIWSPCSTDVTLRFNSSIMVRTNSTNEESMTTLDQTDLWPSLQHSLQWRRC